MGYIHQTVAHGAQIKEQLGKCSRSPISAANMCTIIVTDGPADILAVGAMVCSFNLVARLVCGEQKQPRKAADVLGNDTILEYHHIIEKARHQKPTNA